MSWYASDHCTELGEIHEVLDEFRNTLAPETCFVDVALHVGTNEHIRIILPSGATFTLDDATAIRDSLTRTIESASR